MKYDSLKNETPPEGKPIEEPELICDLCGEPCEDFQCIRETIVCDWCLKNNKQLNESINYYHGNLQKISTSPRNH